MVKVVNYLVVISCEIIKQVLVIKLIAINHEMVAEKYEITYIPYKAWEKCCFREKKSCLGVDIDSSFMAFSELSRVN